MQTGDETNASLRQASPQKVLLQRMIPVFFAWIFVYMFVQGNNGFFARTVDVIDATWVKLVFLNIPLHLLLLGVMSVCASYDRPAVVKAGLWAGALNAVLVLGHVILSVATA